MMIHFLTQLGIQLSILSPACEAGDFLCSTTDGALLLRAYLPSVAENTVLGGVGVLSQNPYTSLAATAAIGLTSWHYFRQSQSDSENKLTDLKDQQDVQRLIHYYAQQSNLPSLGTIENQPLVEVEANVLFHAMPYVAIDRKQGYQQTTSQALHEWTLKTLAYLLLTGKEYLPNELRCFMALNHLQEHWTALNTSFHLGGQAQDQFSRLRNQFIEMGFDFINQGEINYRDLNECVNFIKGTAPKADNLLYIPITFEYIQINHADSMNSAYYDEAVYESVQAFVDHFQCGYHFEKSIQQKGNTCAEFTVLNGMTKGSLNQYPVIADSHTLRALTNQLAENAAQDPSIEFQY